jgi:simple sugar transport system permease protein
MIRIERRLENVAWLGMIAPVAAIAFALAAVGLLLGLSGHNPLSIYGQMFAAAFTNPGAFSATLLTATPLVFAGLCVAVAFPLKAYNIGGEGQLVVGAIGAAGAGIALGGQPSPVVIAGMIAGGVLGGALWAAVPALLRAYLHTSEILTTLMLNYLAFLLAYFLIFDSPSYWRDLTSPSALVFPQGKIVDASGWWPELTLGAVRVPLGFLIGVLSALALVFVLKHTSFGFRLRVIADAPKAGHYAGMRTKRTLVSVLLLSGAFAGFAGASQIGDFTHLLDPKGLQQAAYGYTAIVAAALGRFHPVGVLFAAVFLGGITNAGFKLQGEELPLGLVGAMQGLMLLSVASAELLSRYRIVIRGRAGSVADDPGGPSPASPEPDAAPAGAAAASEEPAR